MACCCADEETRCAATIVADDAAEWSCRRNIRETLGIGPVVGDGGAQGVAGGAGGGGVTRDRWRGGRKCGGDGHAVLQHHQYVVAPTGPDGASWGRASGIGGILPYKSQRGAT